MSSRRKKRTAAGSDGGSSTKKRTVDAASNDGALEENTMAILDSSGIKDARDLHDDRLCFLEAVRFMAHSPDSGSPPSRRIYDAIFRILIDSRSLELAMSSYHLLVELGKRYPRVYSKKSDAPEGSSSGADELVVLKEAWSPFVLGSDAFQVEGEGKDWCADHLFDPLRFSLLVEQISQALTEGDLFAEGAIKSEGVYEKNVKLAIKNIEHMLLFKYLVSFLEGDFLPRVQLYKETFNWILFRESALNIIVGSRKISFKNFVGECMSVILKQHHHHTPKALQEIRSSEAAFPKLGQDSNVSLAFTLLKLQKETCVSMQKLFTLVMELDSLRKEADLQGFISRVDGCRIPMSDIIVDELTYNKDQVASFLMAFGEPKWKLEVVLQYFSKYCIQSSVRTRRSNENLNEATLEAVFSYLSTIPNMKNIVKRITSKVVQLLLVHSFQASLSLLHDPNHAAGSTERIGGALSQICNRLISSFKILRKVDEHLEITSLEKESLFTAATILMGES